MDEKRNYTLGKEYQTQVVEKAVEYMIADLKNYFADKQTGEISSNNIENYIQRCINLYINYTVIDKVITMTGLKKRILKQDEFSSLGDIIILAREFALYHNILELESTPEGKESWDTLMKELSILFCTGAMMDLYDLSDYINTDLEIENEESQSQLEHIKKVIAVFNSGIEYEHNEFTEVLTGERQINLGIHGINDDVDDDLGLFFNDAIYYLDDTFYDFGYDVAESYLAELNIDNGIGKYKYAYTKYKSNPGKSDHNEDIYEYIDLLSEVVESIKNYIDTETNQETLDIVKYNIKNMIFPHSRGYGLHGLEFSPLGISHAVAFYYLLKIPRIKNKIKQLTKSAEKKYNKLTKIAEKKYKIHRQLTRSAHKKYKYKVNSVNLSEKPSANIFISELWTMSFNPVSRPGFQKDHDDKYTNIINLSWKQNAYSLENIIGSVLDAMGAYSNIYYATDDYWHRKPEFVGYYKGMFKNIEIKHENKTTKKANSAKTIQKNHSKGQSKVYIFHFDDKNVPNIGFNNIDYINNPIAYNLVFPKKLSIILPLCIDTEKSELFNMIRSLSMCYPKVLDINDSEDQLAYIINMCSEIARFKDWTEQCSNEVKRLKKELKSNPLLTTEEVQRITFEITQHDQLRLAYENILNDLKKSYQLWEVDRQLWIDNYTKELDNIRTIILSNKVTIAVNKYHDKINCLLKQSTNSIEAADAIDKQIKAETQAYYDNLNQVIESITDPTELFVCQTARYPGRLKILLAAVEVLLKVYDPNTTDKDIKDKTLRSFKKKISNAKYPYIITNYPYYSYYDEDSLDEEKMARIYKQRKEREKKKQEEKEKKQNGSGSQTTSGI